MKIIEADENLKHTKIKHVAHSVSCDGKMPNVGTASIMRKLHPKMFERYVGYCAAYKNNPTELLGAVQPVITNDKVVINLFIQLEHGSSRQAVDLNVIRTCMKNLNAYADENHIKEIIMPKIGTGGSASWDDIKKIIEEESVDFTAIISIKSK